MFKPVESNKNIASRYTVKAMLEHHGVEEKDALIIQGEGTKASDAVKMINQALKDKKKLFIIEDIDKLED